MNNLNTLKEDGLRYLDSMRHEDSWHFRFCLSNRPSLIGSALAGMLGGLLGFCRQLTQQQKKSWADFINTFQRQDGWYEDWDISEENLCPGYMKDRALLHRTRHALFALNTLGHRPVNSLSFINQWLSPGTMRKWLESLDLSDYWYSSNMMMDAAIFLIDHSMSSGNKDGFNAVSEMLDFCDEHIHPETGYHDAGKSEIRNAMAGAMHLYPIYIIMNRKIKRIPTIIDTTVDLQQPDGLFGYKSGTGGEDCLDYDAVMILSNMYSMTDDVSRKSLIQECFRKCLEGIYINKNNDGGFACNRRDEPYFFGTLTTKVPSGGSSLWATYSRILTIIMISKILHPENAKSWKLNHNPMEIWNGRGYIVKS